MTVDIIEEEQGLSLNKEGHLEVHLSKRNPPCGGYDVIGNSRSATDRSAVERRAAEYLRDR